MRELSLFSGAGGGLVGSHHLLKWETVGYVEYENYCQQIIAQRIRDGWLNEAPIYGDIRTFISEGYAEVYKGMVDVITAGFPCQPFSVAGAQRGEYDPKNMWPATIECIRIIRPHYVYLENVPGLLSTGQELLLIAYEKIRQADLFGAADKNSLAGRFLRCIIKAVGQRYIGRVLGDLAEAGYDAEWGVLSAADVGAHQVRERLWLLAHANSA